VKKARTKVSIDVGSARRVPRDLWSWIDYAIVSEDYADAFLVPCDPQKSVQQLLDFGVAMGAVTCGSSGSYFADSESSCFQPALPVDVRDTTGAGDVFHGAALYGILCGYKIQEIALFASAAAALSCTKVGGKEGIPALSEIKGYLTYLNENNEFITRRHTIR
jgi:sulfofructose kinase